MTRRPSACDGLNLGPASATCNPSPKNSLHYRSTRPAGRHSDCPRISITRSSRDGSPTRKVLDRQPCGHPLHRFWLRRDDASRLRKIGQRRPGAKSRGSDPIPALRRPPPAVHSGSGGLAKSERFLNRGDGHRRGREVAVLGPAPPSPWRGCSPQSNGRDVCYRDAATASRVSRKDRKRNGRLPQSASRKLTVDSRPDHVSPLTARLGGKRTDKFRATTLGKPSALHAIAEGLGRPRPRPPSILSFRT